MKRGAGRSSWMLAAGVVAGALASAGQQVNPPTVTLPQMAGQNEQMEAPVAGQVEIQSSPLADPVLAECLGLIEKHDYTDAGQKIQSYLHDHPDSATGHFLLGYALYRENKPRESLAEYTSGARLRKPEANDLAVVAMDYILLSDYADADKWLTQAAAWSPDNELYCYYLGRTKYAENHFQEAVDVFGQCLRLAPHDLRAEYNLGLAYAGLGRNDAATTAYLTAIAWERGSDAQDPQPYLDLGVLLLDESKPDQALPQLQKAVAIDPKNPRAHEELAQTWQQLQNLAKADVEMQAAVALAPEVPSLHFEMGRIFQREGLSAKAKEEFARCAALNATHSTDSAETPNPAPPNEKK